MVEIHRQAQHVGAEEGGILLLTGNVGAGIGLDQPVQPQDAGVPFAAHVDIGGPHVANGLLKGRDGGPVHPPLPAKGGVDGGDVPAHPAVVDLDLAIGARSIGKGQGVIPQQGPGGRVGPS